MRLYDAQINNYAALLTCYGVVGNPAVDIRLKSLKKWLFLWSNHFAYIC